MDVGNEKCNTLECFGLVRGNYERLEKISKTYDHVLSKGFVSDKTQCDMVILSVSEIIVRNP